MTIKQAKKILGSLSKGVSDEQIEKDIRIVELLKNVFFSQHVIFKSPLGASKPKLKVP